MEEAAEPEIMIEGRLYEITRRITHLSEEARLCRGIDDIQKAQICASKLENMIKRFTSELNEYFRIANNPSADKISEMSSIQLDGEEILAELKCTLENNSSTKVDSAKQNRIFSAKIPKLSLPEFSGDVLAWCEFWDIYKSNIHDRKIPNVDKLLYLKSALKGEPRRIIDGFATTNNNYEIALQILKDRYGKPSQIIDAHYSAVSKVKLAATISECRGVFDEIERHLRVLQSLGENTNHNHLRHLIKEKFPEDVIYEMKMKVKEDTVEEMRKCLGVIITAREEASSARATKDQVEVVKEKYTAEALLAPDKSKKTDYEESRTFTRRQDNIAYNEQKPSTSRMPYHNNNKRKLKYEWKGKNNNNCSNPKKWKISCIFCDEEHYADQCHQYKNINERKARLKRRCFSCFSEHHMVKFCKMKKECPHCKRMGHHRALCPEKFHEKEDNTLTTVDEDEPTLLQTAVVKVKYNNKSMECRILLDSGSQRSYVTKEVTRKLELPMVEENRLSIYGFGKKAPEEYYSPRVQLQLITKTNKVIELYVNEVPSISKGVIAPDMTSGSYDKEILADDGSLGEKVDILIGNDYYFNLISTEKIQLNSNLFLINSDFGWIVSGKGPVKSKPKVPEDTLSFITYYRHHEPNYIYFTEPDLPLKNMDISFLWSLESIGITDNPKTTREEEAVKHLNDTIQYMEGRYVVRWPWTQYPPDLPTNFGLAFGRLKGLLQRITKDSIEEYQNILYEQMENGIIEIVTPEDEVYTQKVPPIHYLPHHMVKQTGKKGRIVYDASGKLKDCKSLNECMYRGPSMIGDLVALLIQFRTNKIAITADIEKAFLQIAVQEEDRNVTRFLWIKDLNKPICMDNIIHLRFCRVPFGIIASPFILTATLKYHFSKRAPELLNKIINKCYVDNLVTGTDSTEEAIQLYRTTTEIFGEMSMNMRDWMSNDKTFVSAIAPVLRARQNEEMKILGLRWNMENDSLRLDIKSELFKEENIKEAQSKRKILSTIASMYDPCGICVPLIVPAKLLLQQLWEMKFKWDTILPEELQRRWEDIIQRLKVIKEVEIPRYMGLSEIKGKTKFHCHAFSDASKQAYASVIYLVAEDGKTKNVSFLMAKSKIIPKEERENLRMPRLELMGCYLASKLLTYIKNIIGIPIAKTYLWTDSQIVVSWIYSNKLLPPFYARRVNTIRENKELEVRYIEGGSNPADLATRPGLWDKKSLLWLNGPEFLKHSIPVSPPVLLLGQGPLETHDPEETLSVKTMMSINPTEMAGESPEVDENVGGSTEADENTGGSTEADENQDYEKNEDKQVRSDIEIIQDLQKEYFPQEYQGVKTSLARNLVIIKDIDGVLRCNGRMKNANWSFDKRHPILIPRDTKFTNDLVIDTHRKNYHVGANHTLSKIREIYWIPKGKAYVQRILRKCPECVKHSGGPFKLPPAPALPAERVTYSTPFTYVGVDYMGPLVVNNGSGNCKRWICLYTCLVVRAVHLEVVLDLTAEESLLSLRRMISTRGVPALVTSDNAQHFKLLAETVSTPYCVNEKIKWRFITPLAPWAGGFYERLVGIVKNCLKKTIAKHMLNDTQLVTIIKEIEAVVNSRPLTAVDAELDHILKPSDFLTAGKVITLNDPERILQPQDPSRTKSELIESWRRARIILDEFKDMFNNRYLLSLRERYHHLPREPRITSRLTPSPGQIVQIKGESRNRSDWKTGKIIAIEPSADGACRSAIVQVGNSKYTRSIAHLYPLEVEESEYLNMETTGNTEVTYPMELPVFEVQNDDEQAKKTSSLETPVMTPNDMFEDKSLAEMAGSDKMEVENDVFLPDHNIESIPDANSTALLTKPRREAAVKALEKIKDWTRDLAAFLLHYETLPSAGSVALSANL